MNGVWMKRGAACWGYLTCKSSRTSFTELSFSITRPVLLRKPYNL